MRVIITGGTGLIGSVLVELLAPWGYEVIVLSRNPTLATRHFSQHRDIQSIGWDAQTSAGWGRLITAGSTIVNLAGPVQPTGAGHPTTRRASARVA